MSRDPAGRYAPIESYGVIGDLATVALVGEDAGIDFWCAPAFDSPTVFAALLDAGKGGRFVIGPLLDGARRKQLYLPDTNILLTRFLAPDGLAEVGDLMPLCEEAEGSRPAIVRWLRAVRGEIRYRLLCAPRLDYARAPHRVELDPSGTAALFVPEGGRDDLPTLRLAAPFPLRVEGPDVTAEFALKAGETASVVLEVTGEGDPVTPARVPGLFHATARFWRGWTARSTYQGRWREMVHRSALVLKLLTSREHGSLVAAATFGLPEAVGGERNWDYRYTWVRDASFTLYALMRLGYVGEAERFVAWIEKRCTECPKDGRLQIMYGADGRQRLDEEALDHLEGYRGSKPVRVGNAAYDQLQLDIYGELMDAVYLANKYGQPIAHEAWASLRVTIDWVCENWRRPDEGIWEIRGDRREFLHSRLMCWVAVDRALRLADRRSLPASRARWLETRDAIHEDIHQNFWDPDQRTFVQSKGSKAVDAALLLMPLVRFIGPTDPRWLGTLDAIGRRLADDALVRRYDHADGAAHDGLDGVEGSFTTCSFWYIEALAKAGRVDEARLLFEKMLGYANHLGLYAEELGPSGEHLGNHPQALTHLALISAAYALDRELSGRPREAWSR
jgi:GH15 family glucan-1,4-alpha-glucosidase